MAEKTQECSRVVKELDLFESNHGCGLNVCRPREEIRNGRNTTLTRSRIGVYVFQKAVGR